MQKAPLQSKHKLPSNGNVQPSHQLASNEKVRHALLYKVNALLLYACIGSGTRRVPLCITPRIAMFCTKKLVFASTESILLIYVTILIEVFRLNVSSKTGQPENVSFSN